MTAFRELIISLSIVLGLTAFAAAQTSSEPLKEAQRLARVAEVARQQGRNDDAIKAYETIAVIGKGSPKIAANALLNAGNLYMATGRFPQAAKSFRASLLLDANSPEAQNNLGEALGELKDYPAALQAFQRAVALDSGYAKARYNIGVTYDKLGQLKYAEFVYRLLIRDHPDFPLGYDGLAVTLSKSGRARESIAFHQKAISLNPKDPSLRYNFAISYLMLGDVNGARGQQQQLQALNPAMAQHLAAAIAQPRQ